MTSFPARPIELRGCRPAVAGISLGPGPGRAYILSAGCSRHCIRVSDQLEGTGGTETVSVVEECTYERIWTKQLDRFGTSLHHESWPCQPVSPGHPQSKGMLLPMPGLLAFPHEAAHHFPTPPCRIINSNPSTRRGHSRHPLTSLYLYLALTR